MPPATMRRITSTYQMYKYSITVCICTDMAVQELVMIIKWNEILYRNWLVILRHLVQIDK